jgi:uncharacterized protein YbjT (DUF2867 family)
LILVVGGTGTQGGSVARELLAYGHSVRVLTRDTNSPAAVRIKNAGAEVVRGDMGDPQSLASVLDGVGAVFSVQFLDPFDDTAEKRNANNLTQAMVASGVRQVVHASSVGTDKFPRWQKHESLIKYWNQKWEIEEYIRNGGFDFWMILHPCLFMENFSERLAAVMNPELKNGVIFSTLRPDTRVDMSCGEDVAAFARSAFEHPEQFNKKDITIAGESLTMTEVAEILSRVTGKRVTSEFVSREQAVERGLPLGTVNSQDYMIEVGFQTDIEGLKQYGVPLTSFEDWALRHKDEIVIN